MWRDTVDTVSRQNGVSYALMAGGSYRLTVGNSLNDDLDAVEGRAIDRIMDADSRPFAVGP